MDLGIDISMEKLLEGMTIADLASYLEAQIGASIGGEELPTQATATLLPVISPSPEQRYKPFPLTDIQQAYWLGRQGIFDIGNVAPHAYLEIDNNDLDLERLNQAWQKLMERHDMLRMRLLPNGQQQVAMTTIN